jgi:hypothetical protein
MGHVTVRWRCCRTVRVAINRAGNLSLVRSGRRWIAQREVPEAGACVLRPTIPACST